MLGIWQYLLKIIPWKEDDVYEPITDQAEVVRENIVALKAGRQPQTMRLVQEGDDKAWPYIQHRYQNTSLYWYDVRGLGWKCIDNQIIATNLKKKKLIWSDFSTNFMFENTGTGTDQQTFKIQPGARIPPGWKPAQLPQPPQNLDFDIDQEKRDASQRAGAGGNLYSGDVTQSRKLQKTATEVRTETAKASMLSSASVDRFNDADRYLFAMLWEDLKRLRVPLPIIEQNVFKGNASDEIYDTEWIIVPAASQKTLDPDHQFLKDQEAFSYAMQFKDIVGVRVHEGLKHVLSRHDPNFAEQVLQDPEQQDGALPSVYAVLQQLSQALQIQQERDRQHDEELEKVEKLAIENSEKIEDVEERQKHALVQTQQQKST